MTDIITGLTAREVQERIDRGDVNRISTQSSRSLWDIVRANIFTLFNGIIFSAMLLVLITGQWRDAVFGFVIIINTAIGVATELKSKMTLDKLSILIAAKHTVRRDGQDGDIAHDDIVLDDVLWVKTGEQVPADGVVLENYGVELDESMLTGESRTIKKEIGDDVYSGSTVVSGAAIVRVSAVGENSYAAKLTKEAKVFTKTVSDINQGINTILRVMIVVVVPLCALLIYSQMQTVGGINVAIASGQWRGAVVSAVAGIVGMIPEGLVLLTSLNFALAALRLARINTLVQELEAVETLARVDALNLDKTGTITDGGIAMEDVVYLGDDARYAVPGVTRNYVVQALWDVTHEETPNPTAAAVQEALSDADGQYRASIAIDGEASRVAARVPFSSARKWSSITYREGRDNSGVVSGMWYFGAPEIVTSACTNCDPTVIAHTMEQVKLRAATGARVLVLAYSASQGAEDGIQEAESISANAIPVAVIVCSESVRDDAEETLAWFRSQGVRCRVISGDNPQTVAAIARKVRLTGDDMPRFMDARELPSTPEEVAAVLEDVDVVGRVLPEQKKLIVQALHTQGHTVAMTGDGVNDALALKEADLGIAMGNAAPATKAVAQVVLVDSLFSHLPEVVARGRQVMANMERVASLFLVKTVYSSIISVGVVLSGIAFPYLPRHMTYVGAFTIGAPAFLLALAPNTRRYLPGFLKRVVGVAVPAGLATGLSILMSTWCVPMVMGWAATDGRVLSTENLMQMRSVNVIVLFVLGIVMLASIAQPLLSWRGILVACFAVAGIVGFFIPFVAKFFMLSLPSGQLALVTAGVVGVSVVAWFTLKAIADHIVKRFA